MSDLELDMVNNQELTATYKMLIESGSNHQDIIAVLKIAQKLITCDFDVYQPANFIEKVKHLMNGYMGSGEGL